MMKIIILAICVALSSAARLQKRAACGIDSKMSSADQGLILAAHNERRGEEESEAELALEWDEDLAAKAQEWASKCVWAHGMTKDCNGKNMGQNLYLTRGSSSFPPTPSMATVVTGWYEEKKDYNMDLKTCTEGKMCGHYTQVVWDKTMRVGCGIAQCDEVTVTGSTATWSNAIIVACDYSPAGNMQGEPIYKKGPRCSECEKAVVHGYRCEKNLCLPCVPKHATADKPCTCNKKTCQNGATWEADECACVCPEGFIGKECEVACVDAYPDACVGWSPLCVDERYEKFMTDSCPHTCGLGGCPKKTQN